MKSGTNLEVWIGGGCGGEGVNKRRRGEVREKRRRDACFFCRLFPSTGFRETAERCPEAGQIPFLWRQCVLGWSDVCKSDPTCPEPPRRLSYMYFSPLAIDYYSTAQLILKMFKSTS